MTISSFRHTFNEKKQKNLSKNYIPAWGKNQVDLNQFHWRKQKESLFAVYLPCAGEKPYYQSQSHKYFKMKMWDFLPKPWHKLIQICTISEVLGIIPENIEDKIFIEKRNIFWYEHYPQANEGDISRTKEWLRNFVMKYSFNYNFAYLTSKTFIQIANLPELKIFPANIEHKNPVLEYRRTSNIQQLFEAIKSEYINLLSSRYIVWKKKRSRLAYILELFFDSSSLTFKDLRKSFRKSNCLNIMLPALSTERGCISGGIYLQKEGDTYKLIENLRNLLG
ncbi:MAG: DUF5591 domain-containing protein [Candidatus Sigynarchaeota archaeon]